MANAGDRVLRWWPLLATVLTGIGILVATAYQVSAMKSDLVHAAEIGERERVQLRTADDKIDRRVDSMAGKVEQTRDTVIRIEVEQRTMVRSLESIQSAIEKGNGEQ